MSRIGKWVTWACAALLGCAGSRATPPRQGGTADEQLGSSPAHPVVTCGPREAYDYVAQQPLCPDGTNPFHGDIEQARKSRQGSQGGHPRGHLIDVYVIPCANEARKVYVDLYGCPEYENRLAQLDQESPELKALTNDFDAGAFYRVLSRCQADAQRAADEDAYCLWLVPAALEALGRSEDALVNLHDVCKGMPAASPQSDVRAKYVAVLLITLSQSANQGHYKATAEHRHSLLESFGASCGVSNSEIGRAMSTMAESN